MTVKKIARYTALAKRYSELVLASGSSWKPEYTKEMQAEHQKRASTAQKGDGFMIKQFVTAQEVAEIMGVSVGKAYGIIRELNGQLKNQGFITVPGKVNRRFFEEKCLYGSAAVGE